MRVTIHIDGDELGDVTVAQEQRTRELGGADALPVLADLIDKTTAQVRSAFHLQES